MSTVPYGGGLGAWASGVIRQQARRTMTLRRPNNLNMATTVLAANVASGASAITIKAQSGRLTGRVVKGSKFTIAGVTGTYTVLIDAESPATGILPVVFTPEVATGQSASTGAAVTFSQTYSEVTYPALIRNVSAEDADVTEAGTQVRLLPYDASKPAPEQNDRLDGFPILKVQTIDGDDQTAYYRCHMGVAP